MALWSFFWCSLAMIFITKDSRDCNHQWLQNALWGSFRMCGVKNISFSNKKGSSHGGKTSLVWKAGCSVQGIHVTFCNLISVRGKLGLTGHSFYFAVLTIALVYLAVGLKILNYMLPLCFGELSSRFGSWMVCWSKCMYLHYKYQKIWLAFSS